MKKTFIKFLPISIAIAFVLAFVTACDVSDWAEDVNIYTSNDFLVNPITIQIVDAVDEQTVPSDIVVTLEGKDKDRFFTLFGEKKIEAVDGIVALAVIKADAPTLTKPLEFTVVVAAANCMTVRKTFQLTNSQEGMKKIHVLNLAKMPQGVSVATPSFTSAAGTGLATEVNFASPSTNDKIEQMTVKMGAGTKFLTADGTELSGLVQTQLIHFDIKSKVSLRSSPVDFDYLAVKKGNIIEYITIAPAAIYTLNMTASNKAVKKFSKPLDVTVDIDPNTFNPTMNRKIQAGDVLEILSRNDGEDAWVFEEKATVVSNGTKLQLMYKKTHLSDFLIEFTVRYIATNGNGGISLNSGQIRIESDVPAKTDCNVPLNNYFWSLDFGLETVTGSGPLQNNDTLMTRFGFSDNSILTVKNLEGTTIYTSPPQDLVRGNKVINIKGKLPSANSVAGTFDLSARCENVIYIPKDIQIFYRDMANPNPNEWASLVKIKDGKGCIKGLKLGRKYDFMVPIVNSKGKYFTVTNDFKIPEGVEIPVNGKLVIPVKSPIWNYDNVFTIEKQPDGTYSFSETVDLKPNTCKEILKYTGFVAVQPK
jgi:hypothetical protein